MLTFFGLLLFVGGLAWLGFSIFKSVGNSNRIASYSSHGLEYQSHIDDLNEENTFLSKTKKWAVGPILAGFFVLMTAPYLFYAEPGYIYHVRTVSGAEKVVTDPGYKVYYFGRWNSWKRAMTVQAVATESTVVNNDQVSAETESSTASANLPSIRLMFLDNVDAKGDATVRFRLPVDEDSFLEIAREYRNPENLLRTALIPAFKETFQATTSLMAAETYYSGGRTEFNNEFNNQMTNGIYLVKREEERVTSTQKRSKTANASLDTSEEEIPNQSKTEFKVIKQTDNSGKVIQLAQKFADFGIEVVDARVTDMNPNAAFLKRMTLKQKASADRAIAKEQRIQQQEEKLLAIAKGDRQVAERQAKAKVEQIQKTTDAETTKQLVLTKANQQKEQATIDKETAQINLEKARIDATRIKTLADAEAHKKRALLNADNALQPKLDAEIEIQKVWADAYAKRNVPTTVFGGSGGTSGAPVGGDAEVSNFMKLMTLEAAKRLNYERDVNKK